MAPIELPPLPDDFASTRQSLHRLAEDVIKVAREHATGEWTLTQTPGGFGTPEWGDGNQIRVEGADLVVMRDGEESRAPIASLAGAAKQIGEDWLPGDLELSDERLPVDPAAAVALAAVFAVGQPALEEIRDAAAAKEEPTEPTLWPEHFDLAIEMGNEEAGLRVNYGLSPGDDEHPSPYLYVGPWTAKPEGELWNATGFSGAEMDYAELAAAPDPVAAAVEFSLECRRALVESKEEE
jgi:hypothetical protein